MFLSKNAKRFMSTAAVLAMTVASLVVAPKVEAAEVAPTVTVKGATLKLEGNEDGKQSMRIAVEVSNADVASACGMDITYGGKTTTIATDKEQNKIYDVDTENKKVVYTAVIKNIPDTAFASDFTINGLVKKTAATEYTKTAATKKSVDGIVSALGAEWLEGKIVQKKAEFNNTVLPVAQQPASWNPSDLDKYDKFTLATGKDTEGNIISSSAELKNDEGASYVEVTDCADKSDLSGIVYGVGPSYAGGYIVEIEAKAEGGYKISYPNGGSKSVTSSDWQTIREVINVNPTYSQFSLTHNAGTNKISIKQFKIYKILDQKALGEYVYTKNVKLSAANAIDAPCSWYTDRKNIVAEGDALKCALLGDQNMATSIKFNADGLGYDLSKYSKVTFKLKSDKTTKIRIGISTVATLFSYDARDGSDIFGSKDCEFKTVDKEETVTVDCSSAQAGLLGYGITFQNIMWSSVAQLNPTITISEIKLEA